MAPEAGPPQQGPRTPTDARSRGGRVTGPLRDPHPVLGRSAPTRSQDTGGLWAAEIGVPDDMSSSTQAGAPPALTKAWRARPTSCPATSRAGRALRAAATADPSSAGSGWAHGQAAPLRGLPEPSKPVDTRVPEALTTNFCIEMTKAQTPLRPPAGRGPDQRPWGGSQALRRGGRPHLCCVSLSAFSRLGRKSHTT